MCCQCVRRQKRGTMIDWVTRQQRVRTRHVEGEELVAQVAQALAAAAAAQRGADAHVVALAPQRIRQLVDAQLPPGAGRLLIRRVHCQPQLQGSPKQSGGQHTRQCTCAQAAVHSRSQLHLVSAWGGMQIADVGCRLSVGHRESPGVPPGCAAAAA